MADIVLAGATKSSVYNTVIRPTANGYPGTGTISGTLANVYDDNSDTYYEYYLYHSGDGNTCGEMYVDATWTTACTIYNPYVYTNYWVKVGNYPSAEIKCITSLKLGGVWTVIDTFDTTNPYYSQWTTYSKLTSASYGDCTGIRCYMYGFGYSYEGTRNQTVYLRILEVSLFTFPHYIPPKQCSINTPTWTDSTITANSTKIRKVHIDELRTYINNELSRRGFSTTNFTDSTITANSTKIRKEHIDELREALNRIHIGSCVVDTYYCPQDSLSCVDFTDSTITEDVTLGRRVHITEMRTMIQTLMTSCICEAEQCQYCSDCGYYYQTCSHAGVACNNHKYAECGYTLVNHYICASTNLATGTAHPYRAASGDPISSTAWDNIIPWAMCNYAPPGNNWGSCEYQSGHNHSSDWTCKCNPFTWP